MRFDEEGRKKIQETLHYLADSMYLLNDILKMHTCNDCGIKGKCGHCPRPGESVRYNCPLWQPEAEEKAGPTVEPKRRFYSIGDVADRFLENIEDVKYQRGIRKPISWALYKTWVWFDEHEKER